MSDYTYESLQRWLLRDPRCKDCDEATHRAEVEIIVAAARRTADKTTFWGGCTGSSLYFIGRLAAQMRGARVSSGVIDAPGPALPPFGYRIRYRRTWMTLVTRCYEITLVGKWVSPFRYQATLIMPRCHRDPFKWNGSTVVDLYNPFHTPWRPWLDWAGGVQRVGRRSGNARVGRIESGYY